MTQPQTFLCRMIAPVPVGHRVEMTWFDTPPGLFGGSARKMDEDEPMVRDLDSDIVYTVSWHHSGSLSANPFSDSYPDAIHPDNRPVARVVGKVLACRLVSSSIMSSQWGPHTYLTVQAE